MSLKKPHDTGTYMDAINVKIAEEYKPPPQINILMTHTQRELFNKQIEERMHNYDFSNERDILKRIKVWKNKRSVNEQQRKLKLQALKDVEDMDEKDVEEDVNTETAEVPISCSEHEVAQPSTGPIYTSSYSNGVLLPTKIASTHSHILQPIPLLSPDSNLKKQNLDAKSPLNISEFEGDTSSPFDNVALKSINEVEELAKVLTIEDSSPKQLNCYSNISTAPNNPLFTNYMKVSNSISNPSLYYQQAPALNSYYSSNSTSTSSVPLNYNKSTSMNNYTIQQPYKQEQKIAINRSNIQVANNSFGEIKKLLKDSENGWIGQKDNYADLPDPLNDLPKELQDLSKSISSMGFPLPRVARICKLMGNDNKKVLDHLLAMSELLDLGFPEERISEALILFNNDRDKALDRLVS